PARAIALQFVIRAKAGIWFFLAGPACAGMTKATAGFVFFISFFPDTLAKCRRTPLSLESHGAVHICNRRRGFIPWKVPSLRLLGGASPSAWLQSPHPEIRSLSER